MSIKLKPDLWIKRKYSPKIKDVPEKPLNSDQKQKLSITCWDKCLKAYKNRMVASGLLSDFENSEDLISEAWIAMDEMLNRFDIARCGKVAEYDEPGKKKPKTLEFYFLNFFYGRVNFMACESRSHKKLKNVQSYNGEFSEETNYDPTDLTNLSDSHNYEITSHLLSELKEQDPILQRFFYQTYVLENSYKELVDEYGQDDCKKMKDDLRSFVDGVAKRYRNDFSPQKKGKLKKKRSGRKKRANLTLILGES